MDFDSPGSARLRLPGEVVLAGQEAVSSGGLPSSSTTLAGPSRWAVATLSAVWLAVFLWPLKNLGMLQGPATFLPLFLVLVGAQILPWGWVRPLAALLFSLAYITHFFAPGPWLSGLSRVMREEAQQLWLLIHAGQLLDPLATQLFLFCLIGLYWLIVYAADRVRLWIFYNILAVVVLAAIDGNTQVHPNVAGVGVVLTFVAVLGIHRFQQVVPGVSRFYRVLRYWVPLTGLLAVALSSSLVLPKQGPVWPDPFAAWDWGNGQGVGGNAVKRVIGYQSNNAHLGGSFVPSHSQVLRVTTDSPAYLRGEVYDVYTGKGWIQTAQDVVGTHLGARLPQTGTFQGLPTQQVSQHITVLSNSLRVPFLFGGYSVLQVTADSNQSGTSSSGLAVTPDTDEISANPLRKGETYTLVSREMGVPDGVLSALPSLPANTQTAFPAGVWSLDTQLPITLPADVGALARKLTQGMRNEYAMVNAVQTYLQNTYPYETTNIPVPGPHQDYVAQFLFQSKRGYCNNFSSAMAVMLRTLGIPTRWVTGFTEGTLNPQYNGPSAQYIVSNVDAHSWVEVYFPKVGWVPYDPTPNFNLPYAQSSTPGGGLSNATGGSASPTSPQSKHPQPSPPSPVSGGATPTVGGEAVFLSWWVVVLLLSVGAVVIWKLRWRVVELRHRWVWRSPSSRGMTRALQHLVRYLMKQGDVPNRSLTLRDLASAAHSYEVSGEDYQHLVRTAEQVWYGRRQPDKKDFQRVHRTWWHWLQGAVRRR